METIYNFEEVLRNAGVKIPKSRILKKIFDYRWEEVKSLYYTYLHVLKKAQEEKEDNEKRISVRYPNFVMDGYKGIGRIDVKSFKNPKIAQEILVREIDNLENHMLKMQIWSREVIKQLRSQWIDRLVKEANGRWIVIRGPYKPSEEARLKFHKSIEEKSFAQISEWFETTIEWVVFNTQDEEQVKKIKKKLTVDPNVGRITFLA